jgi:OmpA-OmpF porin, OOP family
MRWRGALLAASLLAAPLAAKAQPIQGLYAGAGAGYDLQQGIRITPTVPGVGSLPLRLDQSNGLAALGSIGYGFGSGWRVEVEGDFLRNGIRAPQITLPPLVILGRPIPGTGFSGTLPSSNVSGHVLQYGVMGNALYDFDIGSRYVFPYLGAGAGYIWNDLTNSGKFAYQAIVGLAFPVPNVPGLSLTAQYRFLDVTAGERYSTSVATPVGRIPVRVSIGPQLNHSFTLGVRYAFSVAPPPAPTPPALAPVAAPAPQPARSYLVFFDWNKATLSNRARQIIRSAADASTRVQYTQIRVNGYTDTSGSARYNQALSVRRAEAVAAELVRFGVPRNAIAIRGFGETHLLVPTGPGVREPQNRRVEIVIA